MRAIVAILATCIAVSFLAASFFFFDINPQSWGQEGRFWFIAISFVSSAVSVCIHKEISP